MAKRTTTVLIATPYFYPIVGGLENYAYAVSTGLVQAGFKVVVVAGDPKVKHITVEKLDGLKIYRLPISFVISNTPINLRWFSMIKKIIASEKVDIVNAHTPVPFMADMAALASGKTTFVLTYHAATLFKKQSLLMNLVAFAYLPFQMATFKKARSVFAASSYVKDSLPERIQAKTFVMPNSTNPTDLPRRSNQKGLVFVGSLDRTHAWKGLDLIFEALSYLKSRNVIVPLTVIGMGNDQDHYESEVARLDLTDSVKFVGQLVSGARDKQVAKAQALITYPTSENDAFPTVFLEAWALGLPIISAKNGPIESAIEDGLSGVLVEPNNPKALAEAIEQAFANPSYLRVMGGYGRSLVENTYNWSTQVKHAANVLEHLA